MHVCLCVTLIMIRSNMQMTAIPCAPIFFLPLIPCAYVIPLDQSVKESAFRQTIARNTLSPPYLGSWTAFLWLLLPSFREEDRFSRCCTFIRDKKSLNFLSLQIVLLFWRREGSSRNSLLTLLIRYNHFGIRKREKDRKNRQASQVLESFGVRQTLRLFSLLLQPSDSPSVLCFHFLPPVSHLLSYRQITLLHTNFLCSCCFLSTSITRRWKRWCVTLVESVESRRSNTCYWKSMN